ncbi:MAG: peptidoglycan D,D-transpeptidase FtsI family protein [Hyphomicrobiaceae bacterium]
MGRSVLITRGIVSRGGQVQEVPSRDEARQRNPMRSAAVIGFVALAFAIVGVQLVRLAAQHDDAPSVAISAPMATGTSRPDLVDRKGRLLANDVEMPSLYVDPQAVVDRDEMVEKLRAVLPELDERELRQVLGDSKKRFAWIERGLAPQVAQQVHNLGLPGLGFRQELKRAYPAGKLAGHVLGGVNVDNRAIGGVEQYLDARGLVDSVLQAQTTTRPAVVLSIDMSVQHALEGELASAVATYHAKGAAGLIMDVNTGEVIASASLPRVDPARPLVNPSPGQVDRLSAGTYELGSIFKMMTVAMALDRGQATPETMIDVSQPLKIGRFQIKDHHTGTGALSVRDVFLKSSNVGAGHLALGAGADVQRAFLARLGLTGQLVTEAGPTAFPMLPKTWGEAETATISFGHGLAVTPLQFAAAASALVNGGTYVTPTFLKRHAGQKADGRKVISQAASAALREMMGANVAEPGGTGRRAAVRGFAVGGKTGTAEIAVKGRYDPNAVIASFVAAFPIEKPRYLTLVLIYEPARAGAPAGQITASRNAAPVTSRLIGRIAPLLDVVPSQLANNG